MLKLKQSKELNSKNIKYEKIVWINEIDFKINLDFGIKISKKNSGLIRIIYSGLNCMIKHGFILMSVRFKAF